MKSLYIAICIVALASLASCIDEYDVVMEDTDNRILVVEGQIVGGTTCEFILQRSTCNQNSIGYPELIPYADVFVVCSDGQVFGATTNYDGHYFVRLGELNPDETYYLQIVMPGEGIYSSEPMHPLPAPEIKQLSYNLTDDGETVQLRLTNDDPHGEMYYKWTYDEHWEINTPLISEWRFSYETVSIVRMELKINRGWCSYSNNKAVFGSNLDYGNGAVRDFVLYSLPNTSNRFNTRYHTKVRQLAISKGEYEYYKQLERQTDQTGGIFTLMPSKLPTNIHNEYGLRAEGYVGVHLNVSEAELYINRNDVGYKLTRSPEIIPDSIAKKETWLGALADKGYCVYQHNVYTDETSWTRPWCIDCRDPYWNASLIRPDFWQDK